MTVLCNVLDAMARGLDAERELLRAALEQMPALLPEVRAAAAVVDRMGRMAAQCRAVVRQHGGGR